MPPAALARPRGGPWRVVRVSSGRTGSRGGGLSLVLRSRRDSLSPPTEKLKDVGLQAPKPVQHPLHPAAAPHHPVPGLLSTHGLFSLPGSSAATALLLQRTNEEEKWLARQRRLRQEKEDRQSQVSEFRQQVLEQHLDLGRPPAPADAEHRPESARWARGWGRRLHEGACV